MLYSQDLKRILVALFVENSNNSIVRTQKASRPRYYIQMVSTSLSAFAKHLAQSDTLAFNVSSYQYQISCFSKAVFSHLTADHIISLSSSLCRRHTICCSCSYSPCSCSSSSPYFFFFFFFFFVSVNVLFGIHISLWLWWLTGIKAPTDYLTN